jgi:hypothetical protein
MTSLSYEEMILLDEESRYQHYMKSPDSSPFYIPIGHCILILEPLVAVIFSNKSYVRLPDNHPWHKLDKLKLMNENHGSFPVKCFGKAWVDLAHFPIRNIQATEWVIKQIPSEKLPLFDDDCTACPDKNTPRNWVDITYNMFFYCTGTGNLDAGQRAIKVTEEWRIRDVQQVMSAILSTPVTSLDIFSRYTPPPPVPKPISKPKTEIEKAYDALILAYSKYSILAHEGSHQEYMIVPKP